MARNLDFQVPFDEQGQQHYPHPYARGFKWVDNYKWRGYLQVHSIARGRSAAYFEARNITGDRYSIFLRDMLDIIQQGHIEEQGWVMNDWTFVKRGSNYGVRLVDAGKALGDE